MIFWIFCPSFYFFYENQNDFIKVEVKPKKFSKFLVRDDFHFGQKMKMYVAKNI